MKINTSDYFEPDTNHQSLSRLSYLRYERLDQGDCLRPIYLTNAPDV